MRAHAAVLLCALLVAFTAAGAQAAPGSISYFSATSSGSISFTVTDITQALKPGSPAAYSFSLGVTTGSSAGSITLTAPHITGTTGSIPQGAFHASCTVVSDTGGIFTSSGTVQLGSSAVTCATLARNTTSTVHFNVNLYLDDTPDSTAFPADAGYTSASLSVTVNAP